MLSIREGLHSCRRMWRALFGRTRSTRLHVNGVHNPWHTEPTENPVWPALDRKLAIENFSFSVQPVL
jgi:hypothetical protein